MTEQHLLSALASIHHSPAIVAVNETGMSVFTTLAGQDRADFDASIPAFHSLGRTGVFKLVPHPRATLGDLQRIPDDQVVRDLLAANLITPATRH